MSSEPVTCVPRFEGGCRARPRKAALNDNSILRSPSNRLPEAAEAKLTKLHLGDTIRWRNFLVVGWLCFDAANPSGTVLTEPKRKDFVSVLRSH